MPLQSTAVRKALIPHITKGVEFIDKVVATIKEHCTSNLIEGHEFYVRHHRMGNIYVREFHMNAREVVVGKIHKKASIFTIVKGKGTIYLSTGEQFPYQAGTIIHGHAGLQRVVVAEEDTIITTTHEVDAEQSFESLEDLLIAKSFDDVELLENVLKERALI